MAAAQNHRICKRPGGLFATGLVAESGRLATNPLRDKLVEDCRTLHGPATKVCNRGDRDKRGFRATPTCVCVCRYIRFTVIQARED